MFDTFDGESAEFVFAVALVLQQGCIDGFSWPVSVQGKARLAVNGHSPSQEA
jgi:hypothetical protein